MLTTLSHADFVYRKPSDPNLCVCVFKNYLEDESNFMDFFLHIKCMFLVYVYLVNL